MPTVGRLAIVLTASSTDFERTMGKAARAVKSTEKEFQQSARRMESIGKKWMFGITTPIIIGLTAVSKAAIDWQDTFADVEKIVGGTAEELMALDKSLRNIASRIPKTHKELANIAAIGARFGITIDNLAGFTETMAKFGDVAEVELEKAAMSIGRLDAIMQSGGNQWERYGSTIKAVGDALAATEQDILDMAEQTAGVAKLAGMTEAQLIGIAGAFAGLGVRAQVGGTAISKMVAKMVEAVAMGNENLTIFAQIAGMTSGDFAKLWREDAGEAFTRFVEGLGKTGDYAFAVLRKLGLSDQRLVRAFMNISQAGDHLRNTVALATKTWEDGTLLAERAEKRYSTIAKRFQVIGNRLKNSVIRIGETLFPLIERVVGFGEKLAEALSRAAEGWAKLPPTVRSTVVNLLLVVAAIGPLIYGLGLINRTIAGVIGAVGTLLSFAGNAVFAFNAWRGGAATLGEALAYLAGGKIKLVILVISVLIVVTLLLLANWEKLKAISVRVWGTISGTVLYAASLITRSIGFILGSLSTVAPSLRGPAQAVSEWSNSLKQAAQSAWRASVPASSAVDTIVESSENLAQSGKKAAEAQEEFAKGIIDAGQAVKRNLQSFDEVHILQDEMSDMPEFDFGLGDFEDFAVPMIPTAFTNIAGIIAEAGENLGRGIETINNGITSLQERFPLLMTVVEGFSAAGKWVKDNWDTVGPILEIVAGAALAVGTGFLVATNPVARFLAVASLVAAAATWIIANWDTIGPWFAALWESIWAVAIPIWNAIKSFLSETWTAIAETAKVIWSDLKTFWANWGDTILALLSGIWRQIGIVIETAINLVKDIIGFVLAVIRGDWSDAWSYVMNIAITVWTFIVNTWQNLVQTAGEVWGTIREKIIDPMLKAYNWLKEKWGGICEWLGETWKTIEETAGKVWRGIANAVIRFVNGIIDAINAMIRGLNKISISIPDWVPILGGKSFGFNLKEIGKIAYLARGGIVTGPTFAMMGEGGRREAVIPLQRDNVIADSVGQAVYEAMVTAMRISQVGRTQPAENKEIVLRLDRATLARAILPALVEEGQRQGFELILKPRAGVVY